MNENIMVIVYDTTSRSYYFSINTPESTPNIFYTANTMSMMPVNNVDPVGYKSDTPPPPNDDPDTSNVII